MNDKLQDQLAQLVEAARKTGGDASSFIQTHAPDFCRQIVAWDFWSSVTCIIVWMAILIGCLYPTIKWWMKKEMSYHEDDARMMVSMIAGITAIIMFILLVIDIQNAIKCKVAPDLVVADKIASLIHPSSK